ncbi:ankyrin repeat-containing domain protein [Bisporella sp. PMI_857]|nr:ankyrin repeat-containing domain protein [Bisporella sp. PMI_857]
MDEKSKAFIAASCESISRRAPALDKICRDYSHAATDFTLKQEDRAYKVKHLKDRALFALGIRRSFTISYRKSGLNGYIFGILASAAEDLKEQCKTVEVVSLRLNRAIVDAICDCELVVRYFESRLLAIQSNKSAQSRKGYRFCLELEKVFVPQRKILAFYKFHLRLNNVKLHDWGLDGKMGKSHQHQAAADAQAIRERWKDENAADFGPRNEKREETSPETKPGKSSLETTLRERTLSPSSYRFLSLTWHLFSHSRLLVQDLCAACLEGDTKEVAQQLRRGAYVNGVDAEGTPLMNAVKSKNQEVVELLLKHGANPNMQDFRRECRSGVTALHYAADLNAPDIVYLLMCNGANSALTYCDHTTDLHRITPLHVARGNCARHIVSISERNGDHSRPTAKDSRGRNPLFWALERQDWTAATCSNLVARSSVDSDGNTPLHLICRYLSHSSTPSEFRTIVNWISSGEFSRLSNAVGETPFQMLASACAKRGSATSLDDERLFGACKDAILEADRYYQARQRYPDDFHDPFITYCFERGHTLTREENIRRYYIREAHDAEILAEQTVIFNSMVEQARITSVIA